MTQATSRPNNISYNAHGNADLAKATGTATAVGVMMICFCF